MHHCKYLPLTGNYHGHAYQVWRRACYVMLCYVNRKELNSLTESANFNGKEIENLKGSVKKATDANKELKNTISSMNNRLKTMNQDLENQREEAERLSEELDN